MLLLRLGCCLLRLAFTFQTLNLLNKMKINHNVITTIHTLGPKGTNCEMAALEWFKKQNIDPKIHLHATLENAIKEVKRDSFSALLSCIVYPDLHNIVFRNLLDIELVDCFIMNTHPMVLASRKSQYPSSILTHPAPQSLINADKIKIYSNSNAEAALNCSLGKADACITTLVCAEEHKLNVLKNFGKVPMGFAIHANKPYVAE